MDIVSWTKRGSLLAVIAASIGWQPAVAQSLDEQYEFYLEGKCGNLGFARTPFPDEEILPGQAGPNLFAVCTGPILLGGPPGSSTSVNGGSAGAASGRGGVVDNSALRRRRERARAEEDKQAYRSGAKLHGAAGADSDASFGAAGVFVSLDYRNEQQDETFYEGGSDADRFLLTAGADHRFTAALLGGVALKVGSVSGDFDSGGAFDARNYGIAVYGSWTPAEGLFVDLSAGFDLKQLETARLLSRQTTTPVAPPAPPIVSYSVAPSTAYGDVDIDAVNADLLIGYDFNVGRVTLGPRAGMTMVNTNVDAYVETGPSPMSLAFDEQEEESLQAIAGLQATVALTVGGTVVVPQLNVNWQHEYRNDQRTITARFAEDLRAAPVKFTFLNQPPDRDVYTARLGAVAIFEGGLSAFIALEKLFAHDYRDQFGASVGVRWEL